MPRALISEISDRRDLSSVEREVGVLAVFSAEWGFGDGIFGGVDLSPKTWALS